jgi:hypothetical protein
MHVLAREPIVKELAEAETDQEPLYSEFDLSFDHCFGLRLNFVERGFSKAFGTELMS